jgi:glutamate dehydrogenase
MTDDVSDLVLADNIHQARALTLDGLRSAARYEDHVALVDELVTAGIVNRQDDALPTRDELLASPARDRGLPRPVLAVLLGHTKNWAFREALKSDVLDAAVVHPFLVAYFPPQLRERFAEHFEAHPLRREIIATAVVNYVINHAGIGFFRRVMHASDADLGRVAGAYIELDRDSGAPDVRAALLDRDAPMADIHAGLLKVGDVIEAAVVARLDGKGSKGAKVLAGVRKELAL